MRSLKNPDDIEKIEAVLFKVGKPFSFVLFKAHDLYVHILCLQSRPLSHQHRLRASWRLPLMMARGFSTSLPVRCFRLLVILPSF